VTIAEMLSRTQGQGQDQGWTCPREGQRHTTTILSQIKMSVRVCVSVCVTNVFSKLVACQKLESLE